MDLIKYFSFFYMFTKKINLLIDKYFYILKYLSTLLLDFYMLLFRKKKLSVHKSTCYFLKSSRYLNPNPNLRYVLTFNYRHQMDS